MKLTLGSDPELMIRDRQTGHIESGIAVLGRGKADKIDLGDGRTIYYDNVLAETNILPSDSRDGTIASFRASLNGIAMYLGDEHEIVAQASHTFEPAQCEHDDAKLFGCEPEYDAWALQICNPPSCTNTFRSAGGHIHIGRGDFGSVLEYDDDEFLLGAWSKAHATRFMDVFVGLPIALIDNDPTSVERKKIYGRAGRHRIPPYGIEYRTPSNYWIGSPVLVGLIHDLTTFAMQRLAEEKTSDALIGRLGQDNVINAVNTNDKHAAANLLEQSGLSDDLKRAVFDRADFKYRSLYEEWQIGK
jgi:hypothetical protein